MGKIDWKKRKLFCEIQNKPETELLDIYEGFIMVVEDYAGMCVPMGYAVYVVPTKSVVGGKFEEDGYIYMINRGHGVGYTPSKVYSSLQACLGAAQNALLDMVREETHFLGKTFDESEEVDDTEKNT